MAKVLNEALTIYRGKDLVKKMNKVGLNIKLMKTDIASLCVSAALHVEEHGSDGINVVNDLVEMTATVVHKNAVAVWLAKFAPVVWDAKAKKFTYSEIKLAAFIKSAESEETTYELDLLSVPTYDELTPPDKPFQVVNLIGLLKSAQKKAESADLEAAKEHGKEHNLTGLAALSKLIAAIESGAYVEPKHNTAIAALN